MSYGRIGFLVNPIRARATPCTSPIAGRRKIATAIEKASGASSYQETPRLYALSGPDSLPISLPFWFRTTSSFLGPEADQATPLGMASWTIAELKRAAPCCRHMRRSRLGFGGGCLQKRTWPLRSASIVKRLPSAYGASANNSGSVNATAAKRRASESGAAPPPRIPETFLRSSPV